MEQETTIDPNNDAPMAKISKISLISSPKEKKEKRENSEFYDEVRTLLSNLYMDATARLRLTYTLRCAKDLSYCNSKHYLAPMPELASQTQSSNLTCTWQQGRYVEFIQTAADMCVRCEFPGDNIFSKLIELILTTSSPKQAYISIVRVFRLFVHTFPPCWLAFRPRYVKFFRKTLNIPKLSSKSNDFISKPNKILDIMFGLLDYTFDSYATMLKKLEDHPDSLNLSQNSSQMDMSNIKSQCFSQWNWEDYGGDFDSFVKLKSDARLERINVVLDLLLQILEIDLTMWLLHYYRKPKEFMFQPEKAPLAWIVFEMNRNVRLTMQVRRLFTIFSKGIAMNLSNTHLKIIERFVSLVMVASHTADIETTIMGIKYPCLQANTKYLIQEFYKIFKSHNTTSLAPFLKVIDLLRIPYVQFEFIDHFLQIFYHSSDMPMSPAKVLNDLNKYSSKYKLRNEISNPDEELSREQFFALLLKALNAYCEMYGLGQLMRFIAIGETIQSLQTVSKSVHHYPNRGRTADVFLLEKMEADKDVWLKQLRMQTCISKPKIDIIIADMCIDKDLLASYRTDLVNCKHIPETIQKLEQVNSTIDFSKWHQFTKMFEFETLP